MTPQIELDKYFTYRSGIETSWRCPRAGYLEQFHLGTGIVRTPRAVWLDTGSAVHVGLACFLQAFTARCEYAVMSTDPPERWFLTCAAERVTDDMEKLAASCIKEALHYFRHSGQYEALSDFQFWEQSALIEGLLWAFFYFSLLPFLTVYEVLWIESEVIHELPEQEDERGQYRVTMTSRPDAICRDRQTGAIAVISWKTIDDVTDWRRLFFKHDLQGMTEGFYSEMLFKQVKQSAQARIKELSSQELTKETAEELRSLLSKWEGVPDEISYVQTIYLVKGKRQKLGIDGPEGMEEAASWSEEGWEGQQWRQNSHLIYPYVLKPEFQGTAQTDCPGCAGDGEHICNAAPPQRKKKKASKGEEQLARMMAVYAWKWRYVRPGNVSHSTLGPSYKRELVTLATTLTIQEYVKNLYEMKVFPSTLAPGDSENPLAKCVVWENPSYRDPVLMERIIRQVNLSELRRFEGLRKVEGYWDEAIGPDNEGFVSLLDELFPQQLTSCNFPWKCQFRTICFDESEKRYDFVTAIPKYYGVRVPHHEPELEQKREMLIQLGAIKS